MPEEINPFAYDYKTKEKQSYAIFVTAALQVLIQTAAQSGFSVNFECGVESLLASVPSDKFSEQAFDSTLGFAKEYHKLLVDWKITGFSQRGQRTRQRSKTSISGPRPSTSDRRRWAGTRRTGSESTGCGLLSWRESAPISSTG